MYERVSQTEDNTLEKENSTTLAFEFKDITESKEVDNHHGNNSMQYFAALSATLLMFAAGTNFGWSGPAFLKLTNREGTDIYATNEQLSWIASLLSLGAIIGPFFGAIIVDKIGRKLTILLNSIPYLISCGLIYYADNVVMLYVARFIVGLAIGVTLNVIPMYIGEIASAPIRGRLSNFITIQSNAGLLAAYIIGPYVSVKLNAFIFGTVPILLIISFIWMPETPYFYLMRGQQEKAKEALQIFRGTHTDVRNEILSMQVALEKQQEEKESFWNLFTIPSNRKALIIVTGLFTYQQIVGVTALLAYAPTIFFELNTGIPASISGIIMTLIGVVTTVGIGFLVDSLGRKKLLLISAITLTVPLLIITSYFYLAYLKIDGIEAFSLVPTIALIIVPFFYGIGVGPLPFVCVAELFPTNVKALANYTMAVYSSVMAFVVIKLYIVITVYFGTYVMFALYGIFSFTSVIFIIFYVPETKCKTLEEIQSVLKG